MLAATKAFLTFGRVVAARPVIESVTHSDNSVTLPSHQAGDLLIVMGWGAAGTAMPQYVSGSDWQEIAGATSGSRAYWTIATSSAHTVGTWNQATTMTAVAISGHNQSSPIGSGSRFADGQSNTITDSESGFSTLTGIPSNSLMLHWFASTRGTTAANAAISAGLTTESFYLGNWPRWLLSSVDNTYTSTTIATQTASPYWASATIEVLAP